MPAPVVVVRRLTLTTIAILLILGEAWGLTPQERRCQDAAAAAGRKVLSRSMAILAACQRAVARGTSLGVDCLGESTTEKRLRIGAKVAARLGRTCAPEAASTLGPGGDCAGVRTPASLGDCLQGSHDGAAAEVMAAVGVGVVAGKLAGPARRCQADASGRVRAFTLARLRVLQRCRRRPPPDLLPGIECRNAPRVGAQLTALRDRVRRTIAARCAGSGLAGARFGPPCAAPGSTEVLAECLIAVAERASDGAVATEFRDTAFCGDASAAVAARVDALVAQMTLAEKIEQMHGAGIGGVSHTASNARLGIPGLVMIDGPRGVGVTLGRATAFPVGMARGATWDTALEEQVGEVVGIEARAKGASVILAPVLNVLRHPRWGRAQETYGEDSFHLGRMGVAFIRGAQRRVVASAKHFAANSIEDTRFNVDVSMDERTLREVYLPHFRAAVTDGHVGSVMSAYNKVNGQYCGENVHLLHDVLKGDWGFQGFVESDWILGTRSTVPSLTAGLDIEMPAAYHYGAPLADAVAAGMAAEALVDAAVRRILHVQLCFRLDSDPPAPDPAQVETPAHAALALEVARQSIVLLKNQAGVLPLDATRVGSVAVVGALAATANLGDFGSSTVAPSRAVAPLDGIVARAGGATVTHVATAPLSSADEAAVASAGAAVVIAGLTYLDEGEGFIGAGDRTGLVLPNGQDALIAAVAALNPRTIVVLEGSGPVTMPWLDDVEAVVMAWYPGQEGGTAIAEVLFGDVNPSGRLPVTFPRAEADLPPFDNLSRAVTYDAHHGYRHLDRSGRAPLFPFGFGLSYTTFAYANLTVTPPAVAAHGRVRVTAQVTNTGSRAGEEVAQLYVGYQGSRVERAVRDLRGFTRVHLGPGETKSIAFDLRAPDIAFWDAATGGWEVEPITYTVGVGSSSRSLSLTGSFAVRAP